MSDCPTTAWPCCCQCIHHRPVHHHCTIDPLPEGFENMGCVCGVSKGSWVCCPPGIDRVYDNWPEHSLGCELFEQRARMSYASATKLSPRPGF